MSTHTYEEVTAAAAASATLVVADDLTHAQIIARKFESENSDKRAWITTYRDGEWRVQLGGMCPILCTCYDSDGIRHG